MTIRTYTTDVRRLMAAGLRPSLGYHGTLLSPTVEVGGYILPWKQLQTQHPRTHGRAEATYPTYSDLDRAYYTPITIRPPRRFYTGRSAWESAWWWSSNCSDTWARCVLLVEPEGLVDLDKNLHRGFVTA